MNVANQQSCRFGGTYRMLRFCHFQVSQSVVVILTGCRTRMFLLQQGNDELGKCKQRDAFGFYASPKMAPRVITVTSVMKVLSAVTSCLIMQVTKIPTIIVPLHTLYVQFGYHRPDYIYIWSSSELQRDSQFSFFSNGCRLLIYNLIYMMI